MKGPDRTAEEFESILAALSQPFPEQLVKRRVGWRNARGEDQWIDYIEWQTAAALLDQHCPDWSHDVRDIRVVGDLVAVTAAITIKGVTRCGIGVDSAMDERGIKGAEDDALKRAAVKFGVARYLYRPAERKLKAVTPARAEAQNSKGQDAATDKQLAAIYAIAKAKSLDAQLESLSRFRCEPEQLSRNAASELIDHLRNVRISA